MSFISVGLSATVLPFKAQMVAAGQAVSQFGTEVQAAAAKNNKAVTVVAAGMAAVGAAAVAMAAVSVKSATEMETRMQNVATIWTDTGTSVAQAGNQIIAMSKELPQSANNLAEGLYQVASSGFQGAAGMQVLEASATAASAGLTTTAVAATGITAVLNAYGLTAGDASRVSDVLFQTVNLGVVSFEQLSNTLGDFVGVASVAGISIEDVTAAYATMTLNGISASESGTSVNRAIQAIIQPSKEMAATLTAAGYASGQAALDALGLKGVIELLSKATGGSATAMGILVPEMRGLRGVLALMSAAGTNYNRVSDQMTDKSVLLGATQRALAEQAKSTSFQFSIFKNTVSAIGIEFGQALLPILKPVLSLFQTLANVFAGLPGPIQTLITAGGLLGLMAIGVAGGFLLLAPAIAAATTMIGASTVATSALTTAFWALNSAMPILGAISAVLVIATPLIMKWAAAKGEAKKRIDELKDSLDAETGAITDNTEEILRKKIIEEDLAEKAALFGISLETLAAALLGEKDATDQVNAAMDRLTGGTQKYSPELVKLVNAQGDLSSALEQVPGELGEARAAWEKDQVVKNGVTAATKRVTKTNEEAAQAALANAAALDVLAKALSAVTSLDTVLAAATATYTTGQQAITDTVKAGVTERQQVEKDALDQTQKAEDDALTARNQTAKDALAVRQRTETEALELRFRTEMDAYDREARAQQNALDDRQRTEKNAMDDRIALLDVEYDKRKKAENRAYQAEVDRIQGLIDSTFGEEREAHKAELLDLEDTHDARLGAIDQAKKTETRTIKDGLDDKHRTEEEGLDDVLKVDKQHLIDKQAAEKQAVTDGHAAQAAALDVTLAALVTALDLQQQAVTRQLENRQRAEDNAADTRRTSAAGKHVLTVAELQTQLDIQAGIQKTKLADLEAIYKTGGERVTLAMLAELEKLEPGTLSEMAKLGKPTLDKILDGIDLAMKGQDPLALANIFKPLGAAAAAGFTAGVLAAEPGTVSQGLFGPLVPILAGHMPVKRAAGGPVDGLAWVGEDGPELIAARGTVIPAGVSAGLSRWARSAGAGMSAGGGGGVSMPITVSIHVDAHVSAHADPDSVGRAISKQVNDGINGAFDQLGRKIVAKAWRN